MKSPSLLSRIFYAWLVMIFSLSTACSFSTPAPVPLPTETLAPTATSTPLPSATLVPTETSMPTLTSTPLPTDTPEPTPIPAGFHINNEAGFSFTTPEEWEVQEETSQYTSLVEPNAGLLFMASALPEEEATPLDKVAQDFVDAAFPGSERDVSEPFEIALADGETISAHDVAVKINGRSFGIRIAYKHKGGRGYVFLFLMPTSRIERHAETMDSIYASVRAFVPQPFGMAHESTLTLLGGDPENRHVDPATSGASAADVVGLLFSGLVRLSPQLQIVPDLAESWVVSPDGLVYTFTLRAGIKFASGRPITAQDFKDSWERAADPATESTSVLTYLGDIAGVKERAAGDADEIGGVVVLDDRTLQVTLDGPKPYFIAKLTYPTAFVYSVEEALDDPENWVLNSDATGPYSLKEYIETEALIFESNPNYHTPPAIPNLLYLLNPGGSAISLYEEGILDFIYLGSEAAERVRRADDPLHAEWLSTTTLCTNLVQVNNSMPPMDDPAVRKAFAIAIDRNTYVERLTNNLDLPAVSILPPAMPGFSPDNQVEGFDSAAARQALQSSTYSANLPPITISVSGFGDSERDDVAALIEMWQTNLGVNVQVEYLDPIEFTEAARELHGQLVLYGWCADYPDPENFLDVLYHTDSNYNASGYSNPELDTLVEKARTELDPAARLQLYQQAEVLLLSDYAAIPLMHSVYDVLVKPRVQGFILSPMHTGILHLLSLKP